MGLKYSLIFFTIFSLSFTACRKQKLKKSVIAASTQNRPSEKWEKTAPEEIKVEKYTFNIKNTDFETCKIKSKVTINSDRLKKSIPVNIHIKKDSIIWVSITVGLEIARAVITPDSIQILNKIYSEYYASSFKELSQMFKFDINFSMLQSAILGNMPIQVGKEDIYSDEKNYLKIAQIRDRLNINNKFDTENKRLYAVDAFDNETKTNMNVNYKNFILENNAAVPTLIEMLFLNTAKNERIGLDFEHSKFDFLDRNLRFPFNVPKSYKRTKIPFFDK